MTKYIALFRGINVGGKSSLPMKTLVSILEGLGARNIRTYIQSGNAAFQSDESDAARLSDQIGAGVMACCGFTPQVLILTLADLDKAIANNPFSEDDPSALHLGFLAAAPMNVDLAKLESLRKESERFEMIGRVFYLYAPEGVGRSKLAAGSEKILGVPMTDRNWNTVQKVREMAKEIGV